jgi:hypothetical protein
MDRFDGTTLAFDVFASRNGDLIMTCPPLWNLTNRFTASRIQRPGGGPIVRPRVVHRHLHDMVVLPECGRDGAVIDGPLGYFVLPPCDDEGERFTGRRVLMTMSKNNNLRWIQDWMCFHRDVHGADAMLLFDNGSTDYTASELCEAVGAVDGYAVTDVVAWPYLYGPQGTMSGTGWDSHFSQLGMLETARRRYLATAAAVMNADVDELVVPRRGTGSVFAAAAAARQSVISYHGVWVPNITPDLQNSVPRHRDFHHLEHVRWELGRHRIPRRSWFPNKWTVVPHRTPDTAQWMVHAVQGVPASRIVSRRYRFAHFRGLSNSWKYDRQTRERLDPRLHTEDADFAAAMSRVSWSR